MLTGASIANGTYILRPGCARFATSRTYDAVGNVQTVATTLPGGTSNQGFCYDEQNRVTWTDGQTGTGPCGVSLTTGTLTAAAYGPGTVTYDALDRMSTTASGTNVYGDPHHIHALTSMGPNYSASYDAAGNMTCRSTSSSSQCTTSAQNGQIMAYNSAGRMTTWQNAPTSPTSTQAMAYDGEGNRVALQVTGGTPTYYLGSLEEISGSSLIKYFAGGSGLPTAERVGTGGSVYYLASNGLGSLDMALDSSGNVTAQQLFFPYGRPFYSSGSMPTAKGFTGQRADGATSGLVYLNARYYDYVGRAFLSADMANDGLNRYAYAHWNPETLSDPSGQTVRNCGVSSDICTGAGGGYAGTNPTTNGGEDPPTKDCHATGTCGGGGCKTNCGGGGVARRTVVEGAETVAPRHQAMHRF